jgi:large subunit ribosomal protein L21
MYAVIRTGGKQYRVTAGDILEVEKIDANIGDTVTFDDVLLVSNGDGATIGQPTVAGASVAARITGQYRGKKILVFRYRPKKRIRVRKGHRQYLTRLEIQSVRVDGESYGSAMASAAVEEEVVEAAIDELTAEVEAAEPAEAVEEISAEVTASADEADDDDEEAANEAAESDKG